MEFAPAAPFLLISFCYYDIINRGNANIMKGALQDKMIRTQVQLTKEQFEALKSISASEGISMAALIRQGVERLLAEKYHQNRPKQVERAINAAGRFHAGLKDLAREHDKYYREAISE